MKKIVLLSLLLLLLGLVGFNEYTKSTIYYDINNEELKSIVIDYIHRGKGFKIAEQSSYVAIILQKYEPDNDTSYVYKIRYFSEDELLTEDYHPLLFCKPIENKKIVFLSGMNHFLKIDTPDIENFIEDKNSETYLFFKNTIMDAYVEKRKNKDIILPFIWIDYNGRYVNAYFNASGKLIDTSYVNYNIGFRKLD